MSTLSLIKQILGLSGTASQNHHWDGSVANQLSLKRGTPASPGAKVIDIVDGKVEFPSGRTYASGEVIQVVQGTDPGGNTASTSYVNLMTTLASITPKSTNSKLIIEISGEFIQTALSGYNPIAVFNIFRTTVANLLNANNAYIGGVYTSGGIGIAQIGCLRAVYSNTTLDAKSFGLCAYTNNASSAAYGIYLNWTIMEVQN